MNNAMRHMIAPVLMSLIITVCAAACIGLPISEKGNNKLNATLTKYGFYRFSEEQMNQLIAKLGYEGWNCSGAFTNPDGTIFNLILCKKGANLYTYVEINIDGEIKEKSNLSICSLWCNDAGNIFVPYKAEGIASDATKYAVFQDIDSSGNLTAKSIDVKFTQDGRFCIIFGCTDKEQVFFTNSIKFPLLNIKGYRDIFSRNNKLFVIYIILEEE